MKVVFSDTFLTGHAEIDREHREMFELLDRLAQSATDGTAWRCGEHVNAFLDACRNHFRHEESILSELKFPRLEAHRVFHTELLKKGEAITAICQEPCPPDVLENIVTDLVRFFLDDVVRADTDFASFLQEHGVADPHPCAPSGV